MFGELKLFATGRHGRAEETSQLRGDRSNGRLVYTALPGEGRALSLVQSIGEGRI